MQVECVQRNVVIFPSLAVTAQAAEWSTTLGSVGTVFILGPEHGTFAHMSMYQASYPLEQADALETAVRSVARRHQPFEVAMNGFDIFWGTFVFWDAVKNAALSALHYELLERLNPLRMGRLLPTHEEILRNESVPPVLRESVRRYGNPLCDLAERPHITLARLMREEKGARALALLPKVPKRICFRTNAIALTDVGPHGTCTKILREFPFSPS